MDKLFTTEVMLLMMVIAILGSIAVKNANFTPNPRIAKWTKIVCIGLFVATGVASFYFSK